MKNYKTDDSLFTEIFYPASYGNIDIIRWMNNNDTAMMRYVEDMDANEEAMLLDQKLDIYPGIKTFTVISSSWQRIAYAYLTIKSTYEQELKMPRDTAFLNIDSFEDFVFSLNDEKLGPGWYTAITPVKTWIYSPNNSIDYVFRYETIHEDFKVFQEYFCSDTPLELKETENFDPDWRSMYTEKTKDHIAKLFKEDIEYFNFKF
jgi:hypothetical protein